jgi:hypothetical protein
MEDYALFMFGVVVGFAIGGEVGWRLYRSGIRSGRH